MSSSDWKIQRHGTRCHATDREFEEGETFYSAIFWAEGELERRDFCIEAWKERFETSRVVDASERSAPEGAAPEGAAPEGAAPDEGESEEDESEDASDGPRPFSFWRTRLPRSDEPPRIAFQEAEDCFWQLVEPAKLDADTRSLAYVLSLLLLRKKKIKLISTERRRGKEFSRFESLDGERTIELVDPGLEIADIERLEERVRELLFPGLVVAEKGPAEGGAENEGADDGGQAGAEAAVAVEAPAAEPSDGESVEEGSPR